MAAVFGALGIPEPAGLEFCELTKTTSQSLGNETVVPVSWQSVRGDNKHWFQPSDPVNLRCPISGVWLVTCVIYISGSGGQKRGFFGYFPTNGVSVFRQPLATFARNNGTANTQPCKITTLCPINAGEVFYIGAFQNSGSTLTIDGAGLIRFVFMGSLP